MTLLRNNSSLDLGQLEVSDQRRLPVDDGTTANTQSVSGETLQLYYYNASAGALTIDAGQAAGTVVVGAIANKNICNSLGDSVGCYGDTSLTFTTGTILTTLRPFRGLLAEKAESNGLNNLKAAQARANAVTAGFARGEYCIDHERGVVYGVKATTGTTDTIAYKVLAPGGGNSVPENINIAKIGGTAVDVGAGVVSTGTQRVTEGSTSMQSKGLDATGQDAYATIKTPSANATHIKISLEGSFGAVISLDGGTTDHIDVPANSVIVLDAVTITSGVAIQAKNFTAGSNYSNLSVSIW